MLTSLVIQDVVLIDKLEIAFTEGLNVLTGETGAGKSILMDALSLALGARSDAGLLRSGAKQAQVTARFEGPSPEQLNSLLEEHGIESEDSLILRRSIAADGKSRAFVNDQPVSVALLRRVGDRLLEVHGQFETHGLLNPSSHRDLVDSFAGLVPLKRDTAEKFDVWKKADQAYAEALLNRERGKAEADFLRAAVAELDDLDPQPDETERLTEKRKRLQNRDKIMDALQQAETALTGDHGAEARLAQAGKVLARLSGVNADLARILAIVDRAAADAAEAREQLSSFVHAVETDEETLDAVEERLFKLRAVARKHNAQPESLPELRDALAARLSLLDDGETSLAALAQKRQIAKASYLELARKLGEKRRAAGEKLAAELMMELPPLKLERAVFSVRCEKLPEDQWSADGMDKLAFVAATNVGASEGPLHKIASGGELARFMLALKVVLAKADPVPTLVFDEVDSGIGGATASAVGERLARLGESMQVIVVTHSPQVAARAKNHMKVEKKIKNGQTFSLVSNLDANARHEEIARMLAGEKTTEAARQAAKSLIEGSQNPLSTARTGKRKTAAA